MKPESGMLLHASCSDIDYKILSVGKDANGTDVLSFHCDDINDFLHTEANADPPNLMYVSPSEVVFHDVPWKAVEGHDELITLATPEGGCYRCVYLFSLKRASGAKGKKP